MNITDHQLHDEPSLLGSLFNDLRAGFAAIQEEVKRPWREHLSFGPLPVHWDRRPSKASGAPLHAARIAPKSH